MDADKDEVALKEQGENGTSEVENSTSNEPAEEGVAAVSNEKDSTVPDASANLLQEADGTAPEEQGWPASTEASSAPSDPQVEAQDGTLEDPVDSNTEPVESATKFTPGKPSAVITPVLEKENVPISAEGGDEKKVQLAPTEGGDEKKVQLAPTEEQKEFSVAARSLGDMFLQTMTESKPKVIQREASEEIDVDEYQSMSQEEENEGKASKPEEERREEKTFSSNATLLGSTFLETLASKGSADSRELQKEPLQPDSKEKYQGPGPGEEKQFSAAATSLGNTFLESLGAPKPTKAPLNGEKAVSFGTETVVNEEKKLSPAATTLGNTFLETLAGTKAPENHGTFEVEPITLTDDSLEILEGGPRHQRTSDGTKNAKAEELGKNFLKILNPSAEYSTEEQAPNDSDDDDDDDDDEDGVAATDSMRNNPLITSTLLSAVDSKFKALRKRSQKSLPEVALLMKNGVKTRSRRGMQGKGLTELLPDTFLGSEAVDFLVQYTASGTREGALEIGRNIAQEFHMFKPCGRLKPLSAQVAGKVAGAIAGTLGKKKREHEELDYEDYLIDDESQIYHFDPDYNLKAELRQMSLEEKMYAFEQGVEKSSHRRGLVIHKKCFVGSGAVSFLVRAKLALTREDAVILGKELASAFNLFEPINRDTEFSDSSTLYKFVSKKHRLFKISDEFTARSVRLLGNLDHLSDSEEDDESVDSELSAIEEDDESYASDSSQSMHSTTPLAEYESLKEVAEIFERGMTVRTHRVKFKKHRNSFFAERAVTFLVTSGLAKTREDAVVLGRRLEREFNLFSDIKGRTDFRDGHVLFRLNPQKKRFTEPFKVVLPLEVIAEQFEETVKIKDYVYRLKTYENTFMGIRAVGTLVNSNLAETRTEAVRIGRLLAEELDLFEPVTGKRKFCDDRAFFRIKPKNQRKKRVTPEIPIMTEEPKEDVPAPLPVRAKSRASLRMTIRRSALAQVTPELLTLAEQFLKEIKVKEHKYRAMGYRQTFVASEAVSYMVNNSMARSRKEAVEFCRQFQNVLKLFGPVEGTEKADFRDDYLLYRFEARFHDVSKSLSFSSLNAEETTETGKFDRLSAKSLPLETIAESFRANVRVGDRRPGTLNLTPLNLGGATSSNLKNKLMGFMTHKNVFIGSEAVDYLVGSGLCETRVDAVELGRSLAREFNLFENVNKEDELKDERNMLYRFVNLDPVLRPVLDEVNIPVSELRELAMLIESKIIVKDQRVRLRVYKDTFRGSDLVDFLVKKKKASSREEAVQIGRAVAKRFNLFGHVTNDRIFEDSDQCFYLTKEEERYKGLRLAKADRKKNIFEGAGEDTSGQLKEEDGEDGELELDDLQILSEDSEWASKLKSFEKKAEASVIMSQSLLGESTDIEVEQERKRRLERWACTFHRLDPRYQIQFFFDAVAQDGVEKDEANLDSMRPMIKFLPNRANVFSVWRPTSLDAIKKMMIGKAVGKGLDIKGKSAKRGKLSGYVPFLQISDNKHKSKIRNPSRDGTVRVYYPADGRRSRDIAAEKLERIAEEMMALVAEAKEVLADEKSSHKIRADALDSMLLDMADPCIRYHDEYAPQRYGIEIPERLFWEAFFVRQDCTRKVGSQYDTGRASSTTLQDLNFAAIRGVPDEGAPKVVIYQNADADSPMNPFELLMAYEEHGRVLPVVSDFDCFLVGTRRVKFQSPLVPSQMDVLKWFINALEFVMTKSKPGDGWNTTWVEKLKEEKTKGFHPVIPRFGFGDPKSYSIMGNAVGRLHATGAVRHGAECFNYYWPQDLDEEFLVIADGLPDNKPWTYVDVEGLQDILEKKIDDGYCFPLNPKWVLADAGRWKVLYDKLINSEKEEVIDAMNVWFPPSSGLREQIEKVHKLRPEGFYVMPDGSEISASKSKSGKFATRGHVVLQLQKLQKGQGTPEQTKNNTRRRTSVTRKGNEGRKLTTDLAVLKAAGRMRKRARRKAS